MDILAAKTVPGATIPSHTEVHTEEEHHSIVAADLIRACAVGAAALLSWFGLSPGIHGIEPLSLVAALA